MKSILASFCLLALFTPSVLAEQWKLVWSDEFEYEGLPDPKKWGYEEGFVRNNELQYYTKARKENARVENGVLVIEGRKEQFQTKDRSASYTSASVITRETANWTYGRIEVCAKLPQGRGVWPAIWTLGIDRSRNRWPKCGEIDILEFVGKEPNVVHANAHFAIDGKHASDGGKLKKDAPYADFHVYAIEWNEEKIDFFFDQTKYHTFSTDKADQGTENPFRRPHYLLINLALGGTWGGEMDHTMLPQKYLIDYVRVYAPGEDR